MNKNEQRAELFLKEVAPLLSTYEKKWQTYFSEIGLEFDIDILNDTIVKCYDTISRLGCKEGLKESMNYLFKAFKMNSLRELQYARNKYREVVEDIEVIGDKLEALFSDYKIAKDLWTEFLFDYIIKEVEMSWDKNSFYLFKLKYVLNVDDETIKKKTKNSDWKKDLRLITKWLKTNVKKEDIYKEFNARYPDIDLSILE